jgi:5-methylcytosine-specific restriction endonuclease McrA
MQHKKIFNYKPLIRSAARKIWMWSPMRKQAIINARVSGRKPLHVSCASCGVQLRESEKPVPYAVDHIVPASEPSAQIHDWNNYFERLFVSAEAQQILCHPCHDTKTAIEDSRRVKKKAARKKRKGVVRGKK